MAGEQSRCPPAVAAQIDSLIRFKIFEDGYSDGVWATTKVINSGGLQNLTIPSCIEDGQYLLRAEMIALHAASSADGAQLYVRTSQSPY